MVRVSESVVRVLVFEGRLFQLLLVCVHSTRDKEAYMNDKERQLAKGAKDSMGRGKGRNYRLWSAGRRRGRGGDRNSRDVGVPYSVVVDRDF